MKTIYKNIALAALAFSAVACTQDEDFAPSYLNDPDAVRITAQVASGNVTGGFTRSNPLGTAEQQAKFNNGDKVAVTAGTQTAVTYTFNGIDTWTPEEGKYLKWVDNNMTFNAWYPVTQGTNATTFTVPTSYADVDAMAAADYMVYTGTQNKTSGNGVTLTMNRKMARIVITPVLNDEFAEGYSITGIKVHANTSGYASGTVQAGNIEVTAFEQNGVYYALLAPTTADANATFLTVILTKTDDSTSQELTVKGIPTTAAGKSYDYTLMVGKDKATIGNVSVADWGTSVTITGGKAEEVNACYLPIGSTFKTAVNNFLTSNTNLTQIKFIADPTWTPQGTPIGESGAYMVANGATLEIRTDAEVFMFNKTSSSMFSGTINNIGSRITSIDFNGCINTSNVTTLAYMFQNCSKLTSLNLSGFNTANVTSLKSMFDNCAALQNITFGNSFSTNKVTTLAYMFQNCYNLTSLDLTGFSFNDNPTTQNMFYYTGGSNATENRIPIKVTETGYNFLKDKTDTNIQYSNAKYVQPDGADWPASEPN